MWGLGAICIENFISTKTKMPRVYPDKISTFDKLLPLKILF